MTNFWRKVYGAYMELTGSWLGVDWELTGSCPEIAIKEKNGKLNESFHELFNWKKSFFATLGENFVSSVNSFMEAQKNLRCGRTKDVHREIISVTIISLSLR